LNRLSCLVAKSRSAHPRCTCSGCWLTQHH